MKKYYFLFSFICITLIPIKSNAQNSSKNGLKKLIGVRVEVIEDKFEGSTTYRMKGNKVKINGAKANTAITGALSLISKNSYLDIPIITTRLQLENHINKDNKSQLAVILKVSMEDNGTFRVMSGESLIFLVDGERMGLSTDGAFNTDDWAVDGSNTVNHARYPITQIQLEKIIKAKTIDFRIMQDSFYMGKAEARDKKGSNFEGSFNKKNFKAWKDFYQEYIIKQ